MKKIIPTSNPAITWIDMTDPSFQELDEIASTYGFPQNLVEDCLEPEHLPKYEDWEGKGFAISRAFDVFSSAKAEGVQSLTRKLAIFFGDNFFVTIHRVPLPFLDKMIEDEKKVTRKPRSTFDLLNSCINRVVATYDQPLELSEQLLDTYEKQLFRNMDVIKHLHDIHFLKRRVSVFRRMLWHTMNAISKIQPKNKNEGSQLQDIKENAQSNYSHADEILEDVNTLLQSHIGIASHRTNEVVRILTLFSVFFLPLTLIAGIYGMNFQKMPELAWEWGYWGALGLMGVVALAIFIWFKKKGLFNNF
ncbi:MAG: magnesium transporter CorA [Deltaproteobacteria bacterium]|nr:magnesium transporter CorA [Deltaproteobacteria bacterium]